MRTRRGFTIVELALALTIVALLGGLAVNLYSRMANKARFTQAVAALKQLQKTETIHFTEHGVYTDNVSLLDFDPVRYDFYVISVTLLDGGMDFAGRADGRGAMAGDLWSVTRDGEPVQDNVAKARF